MERTKIKICGLFRSIDIEYANQAAPDLAGFILTPGFRRSVSRKQAETFRQRLKPQIPAVGVFVNAPCEEIISCLKDDIIQAAQLHGDETEEEIQYIKAVTGRPVAKAVKIQARCDAEAWLDSSADYLIFDSGAGTGVTFNWNLLAGIEREYFLAGGLNLDNLPKALAVLHPGGVDMSSGVETEGVKDLNKMRAAVRLVRNAAAEVNTLSQATGHSQSL